MCKRLEIDIQKVIALDQQHIGVSEIAKRLGVHETTIYSRLKEVGYKSIFASPGRLLPRETRKCAREGCSKTIEVIVGGKKRILVKKYCCQNCSRLVTLDSNIGRIRTPREIRACGCGECAETFKCVITSTKKYIKGHRSREFKELRNSILASSRKPSNKGKNNSNWKGGITPLHKRIRLSSRSINWRTLVFARDNYTCQECNKRGGDMEVHHINPFSKLFKEFLQTYSQFSPTKDKETLVRLSESYNPFWDTDNGKTLCEDCHDLYTEETWKQIKGIHAHL